MALNKVEICGVNTAKLPLLNEKEKQELFVQIKEGNEEAREEKRVSWSGSGTIRIKEKE